MLELIAKILDDIACGVFDGFDLIFGFWPYPEEKP